MQIKVLSRAKGRVFGWWGGMWALDGEDDLFHGA